jgi:hypothetical protein
MKNRDIRLRIGVVGMAGKQIIFVMFMNMMQEYLYLEE